MDSQWIPRGLQRTSFPRFMAWLLPWAGLFAWGLFGAALCLIEGLNQTNMDNRFAFGLWIYLDLTIIAFGAGAFFTGFLLYLLRREALRPVINSAVVLGLICYSGAIIVLMVDVGQPLRAWFTFWHPNTHSMLTEVTFCLTCYLTVLLIEYVPVLLKNRQFRRIPKMLVFEFELHKLMPILAGVGAFLSFFHQGSLGGLYGVMQGRPFAFREAIGIWPTTFFLFILSAVAAGPSFLIVTTRLVESLTRKRLVDDRALRTLGRISGFMLASYLALKAIDTLVWINGTSPAAGFPAFEYYERASFGSWILFLELGVFGVIPALLLLNRRTREHRGWLLTSAGLVLAGVALNRFVLTIQTLALPTLTFDPFLSYLPSWQEVATFTAVVAYGVLLYSLSYRYLPLFPQERELATMK